MSQTRRLAAMLAVDVAGYSRLMGADEEGMLDRLRGPSILRTAPCVAAGLGLHLTARECDAGFAG